MIFFGIPDEDRFEICGEVRAIWTKKDRKRMDEKQLEEYDSSTLRWIRRSFRRGLTSFITTAIDPKS